MRSKCVKERKIYKEGNTSRCENSTEQDGKKAARKRLRDKSRRGIATFHGEFIRWDWISLRFQVRLTSSDFLFARDHHRSTSTYFTLHRNASSLQQSTLFDRKIFSTKTLGSCENDGIASNRDHEIEIPYVYQNINF